MHVHDHASRAVGYATRCRPRRRSAPEAPRCGRSGGGAAAGQLPAAPRPRPRGRSGLGAARRARPPRRHRACSTSGGSGASGWANSFYSAAVQAGTQSWKAFFFGSSDAANFITVDKPPAVAVGDGAVGAHLRRELAGASSCPQALDGVASVGVPLRRGAAVVLAGRRPARRRRAGAHAGRRADVPLQQPGRAAGAAPDDRRLRHGARRSSRAARGGWSLAVDDGRASAS